MCKDCVHYGLLKMITSGDPFYYSGDIPCKRCSRFKLQTNDEFIPKNDSRSWELLTGKGRNIN